MIFSVPYQDPWVFSIAERISHLIKKKFRVAYYYESANNSTFRYRAYNMAQALNLSSTDVSASYFFMTDEKYFSKIADYADILIICRSGYNQQINQIISQFKFRKKRVLFDVDDLVFDHNYVHLIIETLGQDPNDQAVWDYWFAYTGRMAQTLQWCDGAITTNDYLASKIENFSSLPTSVIPNFMNQEQVSISKDCFFRKKANGFKKDEKIRLGYFSGSPSHRLDFEVIAMALENIMKNDTRLELHIAGYINLPENLCLFRDRVIYHPFRDYLNLQRLISQVDYNLVPLQLNAFTNCKSELKYFESGIVGTVSIASPTFTYVSAITEGKNGYLAKAYQWEAVILGAINDIKKYKEFAIAAYEHSNLHFSWESKCQLIRQVINMA